MENRTLPSYLLDAENAVPEEDVPPIDKLEAWSMDGGCEATDGCWVEADGYCEHGKPSWLIHLGFL
jgi:hypothetical protein